MRAAARCSPLVVALARRRRRGRRRARGDARPRGLGGRPVQHQRHHERRHALRLRRPRARGAQAGRGEPSASTSAAAAQDAVPGADRQRAGAAAHAAVQRRALARGALVRRLRPRRCSSTRERRTPWRASTSACRRTPPCPSPDESLRDRRQPERQAAAAHRAPTTRTEHVHGSSRRRRSTSPPARRRAARRGRTRRCGRTTRRSARSIDSSSRLAFVTLRGGGLFVLDSRATPMRIVAEYDEATIHGNGCGGVETRRQDVRQLRRRHGGQPGRVRRLRVRPRALPRAAGGLICFTPSAEHARRRSWSSARTTASTPTRTARR